MAQKTANLYAGEVSLPSAQPLDLSDFSAAELSQELEKGYSNMKAGETNL